MIEIKNAQEQMSEIFLDAYLRIKTLNQQLVHSPGTLVWKGLGKKYSYWQYYINGKQFQRYIRAKEVSQVKRQIQVMKEQKKRRAVLLRFLNAMKRALKAVKIHWQDVITAYEEKCKDQAQTQEKKQKAKAKAAQKKYARQYKHITDKGDQVASKSEEIIANLLFARGISYEYEKQLSIGNRLLKPDFTVWRKDGSMLLWEHAGLMDVDDYAKKFREKLKLYESAGFIPQKNLIITMDEDGAFSAEEARRMIQLYKLD